MTQFELERWYAELEKAVQRAGSLTHFVTALSLTDLQVEELFAGKAVFDFATASMAQSLFGLEVGLLFKPYVSACQAIAQEDAHAAFPYWELIDLPLATIAAKPQFDNKDPGYTSILNDLNNNGQAKPIVIDGHHRLVFGEKRVASARALGWKTLQAYCLPMQRVWECGENEDFIVEHFTRYERFKLSLYCERTFPVLPATLQAYQQLEKTNKTVRLLNIRDMLPIDWFFNASKKQAYIEQLCYLPAPHMALDLGIIRAKGIAILKWFVECESLTLEQAMRVAQQTPKIQQQLFQLPDLETFFVTINQLQDKAVVPSELPTGLA